MSATCNLFTSLTVIFFAEFIVQMVDLLEFNAPIKRIRIWGGVGWGGLTITPALCCKMIEIWLPRAATASSIQDAV